MHRLQTYTFVQLQSTRQQTTSQIDINTDRIIKHQILADIRDLDINLDINLEQ